MQDTLTSFETKFLDSQINLQAVYWCILSCYRITVLYNRHATNLTLCVISSLSLSFSKKYRGTYVQSNPINKNFHPRDLFQASTAPPSETSLTSESEAGLWKTKNTRYPLHYKHHNSFGPCFPWFSVNYLHHKHNKMIQCTEKYCRINTRFYYIDNKLNHTKHNRFEIKSLTLHPYETSWWIILLLRLTAKRSGSFPSSYHSE